MPRGKVVSAVRIQPLHQVLDAALARREASAIIAHDRELSDPAHRALRAVLLARWRGKLALATAG